MHRINPFAVFFNFPEREHESHSFSSGFFTGGPPTIKTPALGPYPDSLNDLWGLIAKIHGQINPQREQSYEQFLFGAVDWLIVDS
jgi:hypothetical protein